jgi:DNA gyrase/topoisomerase IV subunit A
MFKTLSQRLIEQIELYQKYKDIVDDKTLYDILQNRGVKIDIEVKKDIAA